MVGLRTTGLMPKEIAPVVGLSGAQVRARLSEYGELAGQPSGGSRVDAMIEGLQEIDA
jgi:hypothetical protein